MSEEYNFSTYSEDEEGLIKEIVKLRLENEWLKQTPHMCPTCAGTGRVSRPPHVPGDVIWPAYGTPYYSCRSCDGKGILWRGPMSESR